MSNATLTGLGEIIKGTGRTASWVARHIDPPVHHSTVTRWMNGERAIPEFRRAQLADLLGVPESALGSNGNA